MFYYLCYNVDTINCRHTYKHLWLLSIYSTRYFCANYNIENNQGQGQGPSPEYDPNITVIASNVQETDEIILDVAREIISHLDENATVIGATRLKARYGKPGLVKISLSTLEEKKSVLREKRKLRVRNQSVISFGRRVP